MDSALQEAIKAMFGEDPSISQDKYVVLLTKEALESATSQKGIKAVGAKIGDKVGDFLDDPAKYIVKLPGGNPAEQTHKARMQLIADAIGSAAPAPITAPGSITPTVAAVTLPPVGRAAPTNPGPAGKGATVADTPVEKPPQGDRNQKTAAVKVAELEAKAAEEKRKEAEAKAAEAKALADANAAAAKKAEEDRKKAAEEREAEERRASYARAATISEEGERSAALGAAETARIIREAMAAGATPSTTTPPPTSAATPPPEKAKGFDSSKYPYILIAVLAVLFGLYQQCNDEASPPPEDQAVDQPSPEKVAAVEKQLRATCVELKYAETPDAPRCDELVENYKQVNGIVDTPSDEKEEEGRASKKKTSKRKSPLDD